MEVDKSSLVVSKAGRDQGQLFYVIDADEQYVYLADGKSRKLEKPKRITRSTALFFLDGGIMTAKNIP